MSSPTFSVIIPDTDSLHIGRILRRLHEQTIDGAAFEVLVVGSDRPGLVIPDERTRFIPTAPPDCASDKRNLGMRQARGRVYLFLDDDCLPATDWLEQHAARQQSGEVVVGGAVTFGRQNNWQLADNVSAFHDLLPFTAPGPRDYLAAANLSVARAAVERGGLMEPRKNRAEDLEWTVRLRDCGYRLYFEPRALVFHDPARCDWPAVRRHWTDDAPDTLRIRLRYAESLKTPPLTGWRPVYLWAGWAVAAWATLRTFRHPSTWLRYGHTLPLVYLTKLAWCWGAFKSWPLETNVVWPSLV